MKFYKEPLGRRIFIVFNYIFLVLTAIICIFPMLHILAVSFSSNTAVDSGTVIAWPKGFQLDAYELVMGNAKFYAAFWMSVKRTVIGVGVNMLVTMLAAYPLSMNKQKFPGRDLYVWYFLVAMLFSGGLIPTYLIIKETGLLDTIWALILPGAVPVFNVILLQNFIKELPVEISESASIDGAGYWTILRKMILPLSKPVLATLVLFCAVTHWNAWFDGLLYMNRPENYPLQSYLQTIVVEINYEAITDISMIADVSQKNSKSAQIIIAMIPILLIYPFLQKYFTKGIVMGSVKG